MPLPGVGDGVLKAWRGGSRSVMRQEDWMMKSGTGGLLPPMIEKSNKKSLSTLVGVWR